MIGSASAHYTYVVSSCGWYGPIDTFLHTDPAAIIDELGRFVRTRDASQLTAWDASIRLLQQHAAGCVQLEPLAARFAAIFEYELPRDYGRRPDVLLLGNGTVLVLEFKSDSEPTRAALDQVAAYARDLKLYHAACRNRRVLPLLIPMRYEGAVQNIEGVLVIAPRELGQTLLELARQTDMAAADAVAWLNAPYEPAPALIQAARLLFNNEPLPRIKRAESAHIPQTVDLLVQLAQEAARNKLRHLVLLTGVPGSGKTLAGLQFVHRPDLQNLVVSKPGRPGGAPAAFLSGNGPLVQVLQYALKSRAFVQLIKPYIKEYAPRSALPSEHVIVFDEAQRAWDPDRIFEKHGATLGRASEPELLMRIANRIPEWSLVLALVGEGQEIHAGEEAGLGQWRDALKDGWIVHGPPALAGLFPRYQAHDLLSLNTTLRSHVAESVHLWVGLLLNGDLNGARKISVDLHAARFALYISRDLEELKQYVRGRYFGCEEKRYGLVTSSKGTVLARYMNFQPYRKRFPYGPWYEARPDDPDSCCRLSDHVTEFGVQGLELDMPIVCWGNDLTWDGSAWRSSSSRSKGVRDPHRLRLNSYRVLLTRGRDGVCIFVPPEGALDGTYDALVAAGAIPLIP